MSTTLDKLDANRKQMDEIARTIYDENFSRYPLGIITPGLLEAVVQLAVVRGCNACHNQRVQEEIRAELEANRDPR